MAEKERVDVLLVQRGLAESRAQAQRLIMAGQVEAEGQRVHKPSEKIPNQAVLEVTALPRFVSRGGEKLAAALQAFTLDPLDWTCADVGASTGGFTDCLLQSGARKIYAIDVGKGQLHWHLREDARVVVLESTNVRYLESLPEPMDLVVIDVSFISLQLILPVVVGWLAPDGKVVTLIKPQFEAGRGQVGKGGVVRDPAVHEMVLRRVLAGASTIDLHPAGLIPSPLKGPKGNVEYLALFERAKPGKPIGSLISKALPPDEPRTG